MIFFSKEIIQNTVNDVSNKILLDYNDKSITLLCILHSGLMFTTDIYKTINRSDINIDFILLESSKHDTNIGIKVNTMNYITNHNVFIVDSIINSGFHIYWIKNLIKHLNPKSINVITFVFNMKHQKYLSLDDLFYVGHRINTTDKLIGYGMQIEGKYGNLPIIGEWRGV